MYQQLKVSDGEVEVILSAKRLGNIDASGSFTVTLDDGRENMSYNLKRSYYGLLVVPGIWRDLDDFSSGSVLLCMASEHYEADDYIRDYEEFVNYTGVK